ncbi:MAG: 3TM-type holin, partial [Burkholderiaceae bacterium]
INKVLDFIPDPKQRAEAMESLMTNLQQWDAQQNAVNVEEAKSTNLFVAGWRPAIGWVCAIALFYTYILTPFATWGFAIAEVEVPPMPKLDNNLWELMFGMLGMGGLRTLEKMKGVAR